MKKMRKFLAFALAMIMCLGMAVTASAETSKTTLKVNDPTDKTYSYKVYQIFVGDVNETHDKLSNVKYGSDYKGKTPGADVEKADLDAIKDAQAFAENLVKNDLLQGGISIQSRQELEVEPGYYLIVDVTNVDNQNDSRSNYLVQIVGDTSIAPKRNPNPTPDKEIDDESDDKKATSEYSVGDPVPFKLTATLGDSVVDNYEKYALTFVDTMSSGLDFVTGSIEVKIDDKVVDGGYTINYDGTTRVLTVDFTDVIALGAGNGSVIEVTYKATLNSNAAVTEENKVKIEFSNDPNGTGKGTTTEPKVEVLTYTLTFDKVDGDGNALAGAGFTLQKKGEDGTYADFGSEATASLVDGKYTYTFKGLGEGDYKLVETTTPDGYNTMADKEFSITKDSDGKLSIIGWDDEDNDRVATGIVANLAGSQLPSTGGIGTTIFYVVGGILIAGAGILLITKKRMGKEQ